MQAFTLLLFDAMDINTAIERAGSVSALARLLGVKRQAVQQYRLSGLPAPRERQLKELKPAWFRKARA